MRWLHLTDLHVGRRDSATETLVFRELVADIANLKGEPFDAVFLTGDLAWSGAAAEYERLVKLVIHPLRTISALRDADFLAVPGNHDIDNEAADPITENSLGPRRFGAFFGEDEDGIRARRFRANAFKNYENFCTDESIITCMPTREVSIVRHLTPSKGLPIRVILANTAFFCDKDRAETEERGHLPGPVRSIRHRLSGPPYGTTFVLGHHPIDWFRFTDREPLRRLLLEHHAVYLHGHVHHLDCEFGSGGVRSVGFCAAYQASEAQIESPHYFNGYSTCHHDGELHICPRAWLGSAGRWAVAQSVPADFQKRSSRLENGWALSLGHTSPGDPRRQPLPRVEQPSTLRLDVPGDHRTMLKLVRAAGLLDADLESASYQGAAVGYHRYTSGLHALWITPEQSRTLSRQDIEAANTEIDYQGLASITLITAGTTGRSARESLDKLAKTQKRIRAIDSNDLYRSFTEQLGNNLHKLSENQSSERSTSLAVVNGDIFFCITDTRQSEWFLLATLDGSTIEETHPAVIGLRHRFVEFAELAYGESGSTKHTATDIFDKQEYLRFLENKTRKVRYAGLAATGLRLPDIPLQNLYVPAEGTANLTRASEVAVQRIATEILASSLVDDTIIRQQIEEKVRAMLEGRARDEGTALQTFYRENHALLVLGDPGSGKTLFVNRAILACVSATDPDHEWAGEHVPVYTALASLARHATALERALDEDGLLLAISRCAAAEGLAIPPLTLRALLENGRCALFFDGLDEIASLDQRLKIFQAVVDLLRHWLPAGNRFIITSRPSAVDDLPSLKELKSFSLRGLSTEKMRALAERIISARTGDSPGHLMTDGRRELRPEDLANVDAIIHECNTSPGLRQLASNPLLFTLLILIYLNNGSLDASRRHRVYEQAVETLASIRVRDIGTTGPISDSDLRRRLGAIALLAFESDSAVLPEWRSSISILAKTMSADQGRTISSGDAEAHIRQIADSTGLIIPDVHCGTGHIAFMHYSLQEYFAAAALAARDDLMDSIKQHFRKPRWKEVFLLCAGVCAARDRLVDYVDAILASSGPDESITVRGLLFALDCAREAEVPPQRVFRILATTITNHLQGTLRHDREQLEQVGERLGVLWGLTQSHVLLDRIAENLQSPSEPIVSASLILLSRMHAVRTLPDTIVGKINAIIWPGEHRRTPAALRSAACAWISSIASLPFDALTLAAALDGADDARNDALDALDVRPGLVPFVTEELLNICSNGSPWQSTRAAALLLRQAKNIEVPIDSEFLMTKLVGSDFPIGQHIAFDVADIGEIDKLLSSPERSSKVLGIGHLAMLPDKGAHSADRLLSMIESQSDDSLVALSIRALANSEPARSALTEAEVRALANRLVASSDSVFSALLALFARLSHLETACSALITSLKNNSSRRRKLTAFQAAASSDAKSVRLAVFDCLAETDLLNNGQSPLNIAILLAASTGEDASHSTAKKLWLTISDYRADISVRTLALHAFGRIAPPTEENIGRLLDEAPKLRAFADSEFSSALLQLFERASLAPTTDAQVMRRHATGQAYFRALARVSDLSPSEAEVRIRTARRGLDALWRIEARFPNSSQIQATK